MISILCIHKVNNKIKLEKDFYQIYRNGIQFRFYFTPNKLIFILYIFRNGISIAKGNSILPTNVPAIILRRKIRLFQFLFLIPFLSSRHLLRQQLATNFSSVSNFCSNICFPFLFRFYSVSIMFLTLETEMTVSIFCFYIVIFFVVGRVKKMVVKLLS